MAKIIINNFFNRVEGSVLNRGALINCNRLKDLYKIKETKNDNPWTWELLVNTMMYNKQGIHDNWVVWSQSNDYTMIEASMRHLMVIDAQALMSLKKKNYAPIYS